MATANPDVAAYLDEIDPALRPLFDRVLGALIVGYPGAEVVISYGMPTLTAGKHRLHLGAWSHGVSLYGWRADSAQDDAGFAERHPELLHGRGTIRIKPSDAESVTDEELSELARATLAP